MDLPHLFGMFPADLARHLAGRGTAATEGDARRILAHAVAHGREGFPTSRPVSRAVAHAVEAVTRRDRLELVERAEDACDGFVKYLFASPDGALSEAVRIPLETPGRFSVCLSSQVGCAMGCVFCATGGLGFTRNLAAWEMVRAFCSVRDDTPGRVTGAVFMGQGEPLANYDEVIRAAGILAHPCGGRIAAESVSISTVGLPGAIRRYAAEGHRFRLIVSLTSAIEERREALMPITRRHGLDEVWSAVREYQQACRTRVTIAWVVLAGVNTGGDEVAALAERLAGLPCKLNLVDYNGTGEGPFRRADENELDRFRDALQRLHVPIVRRYSGGAATHAACGMLAAVRRRSPSG